MDITKKLLTLLAIFCVIASAGVVCAEDVSQDGYAGSNYDMDQAGYAGSSYDMDQGGYAGSNYDMDQGGYAGSQYAAGEMGGYAGSQYSQTAENATGEPVNETVTAPQDVNATGNVTGNATAPHTMLATGNPILALLAVGAVLGGAAVITRRK